MTKPKELSARAAKLATMKLTEFAEVRIKTLSKHYGVSVRSAIRKFVAWLGHDPLVSEVTVDLTNEWEAQLVKSGYKCPYRFREFVEGTIRWWNPDAIPNRRPLYSPGDETTFAGIVLGPYLSQKSTITSKSTRRHYHILCKNLDEMLGRPFQLSDLTDEMAARFVAWLQNQPRKLSPHTVCQRLHYLKSVWRWMFAKGMVKVSPTIAPPKAPDPIPQAWTLDQFRKLLEHASKEPGTIANVPAGQWWESLLLFIFYHGERIGAVLAARTGDYDPETQTLTIHGEDRKGGVKPAIYHLMPHVNERIKALIALDAKRERIWPWVEYETGLFYRFSKLVKGSGLPYVSGKSGFHRIRRTCASYIEAAGGDATKHLGHSRRSVTEKHYLDVRIAQRQNYAELLPDPMAGSPSPPEQN